MPAEIDTGGPRVLHCVERADCPLTKPPPIISSLSIIAGAVVGHRVGSPTRRSPHRQPRHRRFSRCRRHRCCCCCSTGVPTAIGSSSVEPSIIPGNDKRNEFFHDGASVAHPITSSNDLVGLEKLGEQRCARNYRETTLECRETRTRVDYASPTDDRDIADVGKIVGREAVVPVDDTRQRRLSHSTETTTTTTTTTTSTRHLARAIWKNGRDAIGQSSSAIEIRLFDGCGGCGCVESKRGTAFPILARKLEAANSSQRDCCSTTVNNDVPTFENVRVVTRTDEDETREHCVDERACCGWQCGSERDSDDSKSVTSAAAKVTTDRRKTRAQARYNGRSYFQLSLLFFLLAFGNTSLYKSNHGRTIGRSGVVGVGVGVGVGFGALTIGSVVGRVRGLPVDLDAGIRAERSANLSHITGVSRKIQMYIKNRHLQILPDGSVNGSSDDTSEYTIFQRTSVSRGQLKIQGVATCLYLCMDSCGLLYSSREYTDDCVFNETLEQHNYNTYSSVRWSTAKKTLYLGLNRWGQPRRVQAKGHDLGRLSPYARVLTRGASPDVVEALQARMLGTHHNLRHRHNSHHHRNMQQLACPELPPPQEKDGRDKFRCRKRKKRKKRKRRCKKGEKPGPHCDVAEEHRGAGDAETVGDGPPQSKRSCEGAASEELCRKQALDAPAKKRKSRIDSNGTNIANKEKHQRNQHQRGKDVKSKKTGDAGTNKFNSGDSMDEGSTKKLNETIGGKRKRPPALVPRQRPGLSTRKKLTGRITRTSLAANPTVPGETLPSSYPTTSVAPTVASEASSSRETKISSSPKNAVTTGELKIDKSETTTRNGKARKPVEQPFDVFITESSTEHEDHSTLITESSAEISEETRSDEFGLEDDPTGFSGEYSTLMTTMDTTPPERTKDYTSITTPMILTSDELERSSIDEFKGSTGLKSNRLSSEPKKTPIGRLAIFNKNL